MKPIATLLSAAAFAAVTSLGADAGAQKPAAPAPPPTPTTTAYTELNVGGNQVVTFTGDELDGPSGRPSGAMFVRPPGVARVGLIRPRMNFVSELLKSVENL
ncbi:MAG: hypothetical protein J0I07_00845 [Myxococcales bacterium]|nr:hypothetical protein [Myxococcales bacterium]